MEGGELFQAIQKRAESAFTEREAAQIISINFSIKKILKSFLIDLSTLIFYR